MPLPVPGSMEGVAVGFEPMPSGVYMAEVTDVDERTAGPDAKNPGSTYLSVEFTIHDDEYEGRKQWTNVSLTEKALPMLKGFLVGVGYDESEVNAMTELDPDDWEGRQCRIVVSEGRNPKTKEKNNSVKRVLPLDGDESELPG